MTMNPTDTGQMHTLLRKRTSSRELASHLSPDKVAQQSQYLMPIYAKMSKTNWEYKVKHLVGDVSQLAPVEYEGAPGVAHLANEAVSQSQVNVLYE